MPPTTHEPRVAAAMTPAAQQSRSAARHGVGNVENGKELSDSLSSLSLANNCARGEKENTGSSSASGRIARLPAQGALYRAPRTAPVTEATRPTATSSHSAYRTALSPPQVRKLAGSAMRVPLSPTNKIDSDATAKAAFEKVQSEKRVASGLRSA